MKLVSETELDEIYGGTAETSAGCEPGCVEQ